MGYSEETDAPIPEKDPEEDKEKGKENRAWT